MTSNGEDWLTRGHVIERVAARFAALAQPRSADRELLREQGIALSRMVPLLYTVLIANTWGLSVTFIGKAPAWLSVGMPVLLTVICGGRMIHWWRGRDRAADLARVSRELRRMDWLGLLLGLWISAWSFALFPYANDSGKGHIAFFMAITLLASMFCLIAVRSTALIVATVAGTTTVCFFASSGNPNLEAMAATLFAVTLAAMAIVNTHHRSFVHLVNSRAEARQKTEEQGRLLRMIDDMPVAVMTLDPDTFRITYANATAVKLVSAIEHFLPIRADELIGGRIDVFHPGLERECAGLADPVGVPFSTRVTLGTEIVDLNISAVAANDGRYIGLMLTLAIVTREVEAERRILHLAHYDTLTELPNRTTFHDELRNFVGKSNIEAALLYIDLDGFKLINDTRGHGAGDRLLTQVANRLRVLCGEPGMSVARLGGDEFAILARDHDAAMARELADRVIETLTAPYDLAPGNAQIGASVGIALAPDHGVTWEILVARADIALYGAKAAGKGTARVFAPDMEDRLKERMRLEAQLREALRDRRGLLVFYQPIVSIETGAVTAREALVRWRHPIRGWISPAEFVPVAEQSGLIDALGAFVLETACRDAASWEDGARVAVNISATQLGRDMLARHILQALVTSGLAPERLEIEVTETALLDDARDVIGDLRRVRALGVRVALDDFGTGFSSLAHLRLFPFDKIKIDSSFVRDAVSRPDCAAIVRAVADLGRRLGVTTVAEGVETRAQFDRVREEGCTEVQGYLVGRPVPNVPDMSDSAAGHGG